MQYAFLSFLAAMAIGEYIVTGRLSLGGAALVYVVLRLQAERAANHFAKYGKDGPPAPPWHAPEEEPLEPWVKVDAPPPDPEIKVAPLGAKRKQKQYYGPRPEEAPREQAARVLPFPAAEAKKAPAPPPPRPNAAASAAARPRDAEGFTEPRFHGAPHEVLGVEREAGTQQILRAFRHWIKKHHPDHVTANGAVQAGDRARKLHEAKNALLKARQKRSDKAASA